jgi:hypothetical protein
MPMVGLKQVRAARGASPLACEERDFRRSNHKNIFVPTETKGGGFRKRADICAKMQKPFVDGTPANR